MKKNRGCLFLAGILVLVVSFSGCEMIFPPTTYEAHPTKVSYDIVYGYEVNSSGTGRYEITYLCDTPEVLIGTITYNRLYNHEYHTKTLVNNTFIEWNVSGEDEQTYQLGITAHVTAESFLVADLNGKDALTIQELDERHPAIVKKYTQLQGNQTIRFIDPKDTNITEIAETIQANSETNNSFLLAKAVFVWLKENVQYSTHYDEGGVRPAAETLFNKAGDCDDLSFLYVSLCRALDIPARFIRGYLLTEYGNGSVVAIAHAWTEVFVGGDIRNNGWVPVECACVTTSIETDVNQNFGVEDAFHLRLFIDDGSNESLALSLASISYRAYGMNRHIELQPIGEIKKYQELTAQNLVVTEKNIRYYK